MSDLIYRTQCRKLNFKGLGAKTMPNGDNFFTGVWDSVGGKEVHFVYDLYNSIYL